MNARFNSTYAVTGALVALALFLNPGCDSASPPEQSQESETPAAPEGGSATSPSAPQPLVAERDTAGTASTEFPDVDLTELPLSLQMKIGAARQAAQSSPDDPLRAAELGALYYVQGFPEAAVQCLQRGAELRPREFVMWYSLALAQERAELFTEAVESYRRALELDPSYEPAHRRLARVLEATGDAARAAEHRQLSQRPDDVVLSQDRFETILRARGLDPQAVVDEAYGVARSGNFEQAEVMIRDAAAVDGNGVISRTAKGRLLAMQGKMDEAVRELRAVISEHPDAVDAKYELAGVLMLESEVDEAYRLLGEVLDAEPVHAEALKGFVVTRLGRNEREAALTRLAAAREHVPDDGVQICELAELHQRAGLSDEVLALLDRAVRVEPNLAQARHMYGIELYRSGDTDRAREQLQKATEIAPTLATAYLALFEIEYIEKNYVAARAVLRDAGQAVPQSVELANARAWLFATCPDDAIRNGAAALRIADDVARASNYSDPRMLDTLAAAYAENGNFEEARKWIKVAINRARTAQNTAAMEKYQARLVIYEKDQPYRAE